VRIVKRGFKYIEHKKYTAQQTVRRKVDGKWSYTKLGKRFRSFRQRVWNRIYSSFSSRYIQYASEIHRTYADHDLLVTQLLYQGEEKNPSNMARRKFFAHRPKPANNREKNRARRHSDTLKLGAVTPGRKPEPAIRINAAQVRANQLLIGMDPRAIRSITRDRRSGGRGSGLFVGVRNGARECARRHRQMQRRWAA
jgi:hypothetical protein